MSNVAAVVELAEIRLIAVEHKGPYHLIGSAFDRIFTWAHQHGVPIGRGIGIYNDDPREVAPEDLRSLAGMQVPADYQLPESEPEVRIEVIPAGPYATHTHIGPYEWLPGAWQTFMAQTLPNGEPLPPGICFEIYENDPDTTPPDQLITGIYNAAY